VSRLRVRWADGPDDEPAEGEALARLDTVGAPRVETIPGAGRPAAPILVASDGSVVPAGPLQPTDLVLATVTVRLSVETVDGRRLEARHGPDVDAPLIPADAPADLRDALVRAWRRVGKAGRPPGSRSAPLVTIADVEAKRAELRERWEPHEITYGMLARELGVSESTIGRVVRGSRSPD
jgi:hypothetical protein